MTDQRTLRSDRGFSQAQLAVLGAALVGVATMWALFVTAPPRGLVSPYGMVIRLFGGGYLLFVVYSYLK